MRLVYRKWSLKEQSASMDVAMIGKIRELREFLRLS